MALSIRSTPPRSRPRRSKPARSQAGVEVLRKVRERILNWQYPPGAHLAEQALCDEFATSRIPVREALRTLAEQGLVEQVPNSGCFVRQPDVAELHQLYDFRLALELFVVERLARSGPPPGLLVRLRSYWEPCLHIRADAPVDGDELVREDETFHLSLAQAIDNGCIVDALRDINDRLRFVRHMVITTPHRLQDTAGEHLKILAGIEAGNVEAARRALWGNISHARNKVEIALARALTTAHQSRRSIPAARG